MLLLPVLVLLVQQVLTVHTELVVVPAVVTDDHGNRVSGLTQEQFHLYEDGRLRPTAVFHHGEASITLGLVVDRSLSMRPKTPALLMVAAAVLRSIRSV